MLPTELDKYKVLTQMIKNWRQDRPTLQANDSVEELAKLILGEAYELQTAAFIYEIRQTAETLDDLALEIADVLIFGFCLLDYLGIDAYDAIADKTAYNHVRYQAKDFNHGTYTEAVNNCRHRAITQKMKETFYGRNGKPVAIDPEVLNGNLKPQFIFEHVTKQGS